MPNGNGNMVFRGVACFHIKFGDNFFLIVISAISDSKCAWLTPLGVCSASPDPQLLAALLASASRFPFHHQCSTNNYALPRESPLSCAPRFARRHVSQSFGAFRALVHAYNASCTIPRPQSCPSLSSSNWRCVSGNHRQRVGRGVALRASSWRPLHRLLA